ncbi:MAG: galactokinase family protein, partial [Gemmatimonadaceae bacterium]
RIELLGKHVDYAGGRSIVCAIDRGIAFAAAPQGDAVLCATDALSGESREVPLQGESTLHGGDWATYIATVARRVARDCPAARTGVSIVFASDLPAASGLSSSSALLIATFLALARANDWFDDSALGGMQRGRLTPSVLAEYLASVESGRTFAGSAGDAGVGTLGGSQDHTAMLCCRRDLLSRFGFLPTQRLEDIAFPAHLTLAVAFSGVHAAKTGDARDSYNRASRAAAEIVRIWQEQTGNRAVKSLRRVTESRGVPAVRAAIRLAHSADFSADELLRRVDHFAVELDLHGAAAAALSEHDWPRFGDLVSRSQQAAEELLGNQVPETIELTRLALRNGALAASAFGAGFGGSVWALVSTGDAARFLERWREAYGQQFPEPAASATFFASRPADAAHYIA